MKNEKKVVKKTAVSAETQKDVIATRKSCDAAGTGLSHYILMDKKAKR